jgi:hypothetical protein
VTKENKLKFFQQFFSLITDRILENNSYPHGSKAMPMYSAEYLSPYRYSLGATHLNSPNATVTSNSNAVDSQSLHIPDTPNPYTTQAPSLPPTPSLASSSSPSSMHPNLSSFSKHWIWSRNIFYPNFANSASYLSYLNGNAALSTSSSDLPSISKSESLNSNSPAQINEINSDDSTDNQDVVNVIKNN